MNPIEVRLICSAETLSTGSVKKMNSGLENAEIKVTRKDEKSDAGGEITKWQGT